MGRWTTELKSGKHKQAKGTLKDGDSWCCIGLREELIEGVKFGLFHGDWYDEDGMLAMATHRRLENWQLTERITPQESIKLTKIFAHLTQSWRKREWALQLLMDEEVERSMLLAGMNDNGFTFKQIGTLIEKMGWDNSDD